MSWVRTRGRFPAGDPGWFGDLLGGIAKTVVGGAVGLVTGGPTGAIQGAIVGSGILGKRPAPAGPSSPITTPLRLPSTVLGTGMLGTVRPPNGTRNPLLPVPVQMPGGAVIVPDSVKVSGGGLVTPIGSIGGGSATAYYSQPGAAGPTVCGSNGKMQRTHLNRSGYFTKAGYVAPGTKCVANRRRNPLNPRALSRAMSRVHGAQKAIKALVRYENVCRGGKLIVKRAPRRRCK